MNFKELNLLPPIQKALIEAGYKVATEIQSQCIPYTLQGRDILGCAQTGTGKTAAFALPILQKLEKEPVKNKAIKALILTPTRELALQIDDNINVYSQFLNVNSLAIFGGVPQNKQVNALNKGIDILIATPGRLLDLMQQGIVKLNMVNTLVLDEADHMLDMGFINDVKKIIEKIPAKRQTLLFSATMPKSIKKLANNILTNPIEIAVAPVSTTAETVQQYIYFVEKKEKSALLIQLYKNKAIKRSLVFTRTKHGADKLVKLLSKSGINAAAIHGNKSQQSRQRALSNFKEENIRVLIATDIASRGIDIDDLPHVVNYELPNVAETYVHRIGRTGRAGKNGLAISFCGTEEKDDLKQIEKLIGFKLKVKSEIKNGRDLVLQ